MLSVPTILHNYIGRRIVSDRVVFSYVCSVH
jgi:hypothetical protein